MNAKTNVVLVGPMGSGKTAVGRQLAKHLDMEFVDSDAEIERGTGVDISFIFDKEGERGFRVRECAVIADLAARGNMVLATGGGAVLEPGNRRLLRDIGAVVYLRTSLAHQLERTRHSKNRPLLRSGDRAAVLRHLMEVRGPLYDEVADIVVEAGNQRIASTVGEISARLREHGFTAPGLACATAPAPRTTGAPSRLSGLGTVQVSLGDRGYPIHIGPDLLDDGELVRKCIPARQVMIVTNEIVAPLYLSRLEQSLAADQQHAVVLPDGEEHKQLATLGAIIDRLVGEGFRRDACLVALGGGVIGDITGFAAACYQRGIAFAQIPTTLLAQVDASVGGKTAVNHPKAKNMIGAFHQPIAVLADTGTLASLPEREFSAGLAEVIKHSLILDESFLVWLEENMEAILDHEAGALARVVERSCEIKAAIVAEDELERGRRALLNLGHTFGHALESLGAYRDWLHGEAVAVGIVMAAWTSEALGRIDAADCRRVEEVLSRARLPITPDAGIDVDAMLRVMNLDKKADAGGLRMILLERLGGAVAAPAPDAALLRQVIAARAAASDPHTPVRRTTAS